MNNETIHDFSDEQQAEIVKIVEDAIEGARETLRRILFANPRPMPELVAYWSAQPGGLDMEEMQHRAAIIYAISFAKAVETWIGGPACWISAPYEMMENVQRMTTETMAEQVVKLLPVRPPIMSVEELEEAIDERMLESVRAIVTMVDERILEWGQSIDEG